MKIERLANSARLQIIILLLLTVTFLGTLAHILFKKDDLPTKIYRIAIDESWYPLDLFNKDKDLFLFSEEIMQKIATKQKLSIEILPVESENLFAGLDEGDYDAVLSSLMVLEKNATNYVFTSNTVLKEGTESYTFSNSYYLFGPVIVVSASSPIKSVKDLNGMTIGVANEFKPVSYLINNTSINFVYYAYNNVGKLVDDVINQKIDGMILNAIPAYEYTKSPIYQNQLKIVSAPLNREGLRLIVRNTPESKELIVQFNKGLNDLKKNGAYNQLLLKWDLFNPEKP